MLNQSHDETNAMRRERDDLREDLVKLRQEMREDLVKLKQELDR